MGILNQKIFTFVKGVVALLVIISFAQAQPSTDTGPSLGEAFNAGAPEIEPVVVGREKWNEKLWRLSRSNPTRANYLWILQKTSLPRA
jgi:hypothetical protein